MADTNKVKYGISRLAVAKYTPPATVGGIPTWDKPIMWPGAKSLTEDAQSSESTFFADNMKYWGSFQSNGMTGTVEVAKIIEDIGVILWGWAIDTIGGIASGSPGSGDNFAILYQREGDITPERSVIYCCSAGDPSSEANTTEDTTEPQTFTADYTAVPVNVGAEVPYSKYTLVDDPNNPTTHAAYQSWYDKVTLPVFDGE
jgi:phi13 family phage major tail protein